MEKYGIVYVRDYLSERGGGVYPQIADFDASCIFTAAPIIEDDKIWFYYMGGNGNHTGFRESSLARGYIKKDPNLLIILIREKEFEKIFLELASTYEMMKFISSLIFLKMVIKVLR